MGVISVTGLWYLVEAAGVDMQYPKAPRFAPPAITTATAAAPLTTDAPLAKALEVWPELDVRNLYLLGSHRGETFVVDGEGPEFLVRDRANQLVLAVSFAGGWGELRQYGTRVQGRQHWPLVPPPVVAFNGACVATTQLVLGVWMRKLR